MSARNTARLGRVDPGPGYGQKFPYTADATLALAQDGGLIHNTGATEAITLTMPPAIAGLEYVIAQLAGYSITLQPDGSDSFDSSGPGVGKVLFTRGYTVVGCTVDGRWDSIITSPNDYMGWVLAKQYTGALYGANVSVELQEALDALPDEGGAVVFGPDALLYQADDGLVLTDRVGSSLIGFGGPFRNASLEQGGHSSCLSLPDGVPTTRALLLVTSTEAANAYAKGGVLVEGLSMKLNSAAFSGGIGVKLQKGEDDTDFWGNLTLLKGAIYHGSIGLDLDDQVVSGSGFGWINAILQRIEANNFGIKANNSVNQFNAIASIIRQNNQTSNSHYTTRTGGGMVFSFTAPGAVHMVHGCTLEGQQVAYQSGARNVDYRCNYHEFMLDASIVLNGTIDGVLENNYLPDNNRTRHIFLKNCTRIRQAHNSNAIPIIAQNCKDIDTDSTRNLRFTTEQNSHGDYAGSQTLDDYGWWLQSFPARQPTVQATLSSNRPIQTTSVQADASVANHTGVGPDGVVGKCIAVTTTTAFRGVIAEWNSANIDIVAGQWLVLSARVKAIKASSANSPLYFEVRENINGAGAALKGSASVPAAHGESGEWFTLQWFHKVLAGETTWRGELRLAVPVVGNTLVVGGVACNVVDDQPCITPLYSYFGTTDDASYISDGRGNFYGAAKPADANLVWNDGETVRITPLASAGVPAYGVTVSGTGGGTARFAAYPAMDAEAA